jgi:hypothetical protein
MPRMHKGKVEVQVHSFLTSALDEGKWSASHPGWMDPRASLDAAFLRTEKSLAPVRIQTLDHLAHTPVTTDTMLFQLILNLLYTQQ